MAFALTYVLVLALSTSVAAVLAVTAARNRTAPGSFTFALLMAGVIEWLLFHILEVTVADPPLKILFGNLQWIGVAAIPTLWLLFTVQYTDREEYLTGPILAVAAIEPIVQVVLLATNGSHHLLWGPVTVETVSLFGLGTLAVSSAEFGVATYAHAAYSFPVLLAGSALLLVRLVRRRSVFQWQGLAVVVGVVIPWATSLMTLFGVTKLDLTPIVFTATGVLFSLGLFRYGLLDLVPVARNSVIENMHDGFVVLDGKGRVVDLNPAARAMLDPDRLIGDRLDEAAPDLAAAADADRPRDRELSVTVDGERRYVRVSESALAKEHGQLLTLRDITGERRAERRFQAFIEHAEDIVMVLDETGTVTYVSPSVEPVLGYDPEDLFDRHSSDIVHPDDIDDLRETFLDALASPGYTTRVEYRIRNADGEWRTVESVGSNLLENPDVEGVVLNTRDITERKERERDLERANEQLEQANERLEQTNERLEEFASVVSHDLRTPLATAVGRLHLADEEVENEHIEHAQRALDRMDDIIDDVLQMARESETVSDPQPVALDQVAETVWRSLDDGHGTLDVTTERTVEADPLRLRRLLENLFRNAKEHTHEDVTVRVTDLDGVGFAVEDDGPGIPDAERDDVFRYGYSQSDNGTGFGLAIVSEIVDAHGWTIDVAESTSGGARFEIRTDLG